jgi:uncharacterized membrane protein
MTLKEIDSNSTRYLKWILISVGLSIIAIIGLYTYFFYSQGISRDTEQWGQFGDFFGGILNPILSLFNLLILYVVFLKELARDKKTAEDDKDRHLEILHDSVRPLGEFHLSLVNHISIFFKNHGVGPLIIKKITVIRQGQVIADLGETTSKIPFAKGKQISFRNDFLPVGDSATLSKEDTFNLLTIQSNFLVEPDFASHFDTLVSYLGEVSIKIEYNDLYDNCFSKSTTLTQWQGKGGYFLNLTVKS